MALPFREEQLKLSIAACVQCATTLVMRYGDYEKKLFFFLQRWQNTFFFSKKLYCACFIHVR